MSDLVSVIITTHKRKADILKRAIESVLNQTYSNLEIIVVNDAPEYEKRREIEAMLNHYSQNQIRYYLNEISPGACGSRNIGIKEAKGKYIAFLDDDDEFMPSKLKDMIFKFSTSIGLVYSDYFILKNGKELKIQRKFPYYEGSVFDKLLKFNFIGGCSIPIIKKECFESVGGFDEKFPSSQDLDMWLRISAKYDVAYVNKPLVKYHITNEAITSNPDKRIQGWMLLLKKYNAKFELDKKLKNKWQNNIVEILIQNISLRKGLDFYKSCYVGMQRVKNIKVVVRGIIKAILYKMNLRKR